MEVTEMHRNAKNSPQAIHSPSSYLWIHIHTIIKLRQILILTLKSMGEMTLVIHVAHIFLLFLNIGTICI